MSSIWMSKTATVFAATAVAVIPIAVYLYFHQLRQGDKSEEKRVELPLRRYTILFATTTGTAKAFSRRVLQALLHAGVPSRYILIKDVKDYDVDSMNKEDILIFLCSTWSEGRPTESAKHFFSWLDDMRFDFRVDKNHMEKVNFASFGLGGAVYGGNFCKPVLDFDAGMAHLGGRRLCPPVLGDDASDLETKFVDWLEGLVRVLRDKGILDTSPAIRSKPVGSRRDTGKGGISKEERYINPNLLPPESGGCVEGSDDEEEEEDLINKHFITMDDSVGGCGSEGGAEVDVEDLLLRGKDANSSK
jgi:sulfite reductase alpha subunit-like flavoprotein